MLFLEILFYSLLWTFCKNLGVIWAPVVVSNEELITIVMTFVYIHIKNGRFHLFFLNVMFVVLFLDKLSGQA